MDISTSTYDLCLLITNRNYNAFGIVGIQTDNTLILGTDAFSSLKEKKLEKAQFRSKPKTVLTLDTELDFNGYILTIKGNSINLKQKGQGGKIYLIDIKAPNRA